MDTLTYDGNYANVCVNDTQGVVTASCSLPCEGVHVNMNVDECRQLFEDTIKAVRADAQLVLGMAAISASVSKLIARMDIADYKKLLDAVIVLQAQGLYRYEAVRREFPAMPTLRGQMSTFLEALLVQEAYKLPAEPVSQTPIP